MFVEAVHVSEQFGDDLNTVAPTADGQRGLIPAHTFWNATLNVDVASMRSTFFVSIKNALDELYIVDRTRGILPGMPRTVQVGIKFKY
jgi:Fe(3+) dicitrate transport protein